MTTTTNLRDMSYEDLTRRVLHKMERTRRIGWIDYSPGSYDYRVAFARTARVKARIHGIRLSMQELMAA